MDREKLIKCGVDYDDGVRRFAGSIRLYEKYLKRLVDLEVYEELKQAVKEGKVKEGFEAAHKIKAFVGNLGIPALYEEICLVTDLLRSNTEEGVAEHMERIEYLYQDAVGGIKNEIQKE